MGKYEEEIMPYGQTWSITSTPCVDDGDLEGPLSNVQIKKQSGCD